MWRRGVAVVVALISGAAFAACSSSKASGGPLTLRLGYYPNLTHATALVGVADGIFAKNLGSGVTLKTATFNAGPAEVDALFAGAIDAAYIGPNPAINAFQKSNGQAIRIIAGATSGGAALVVKTAIKTAGDLKGKKLATPQLGNTQDVALRAWLRSQALSSNAQGGGDVSILPQDNATTLQTFKSGQIDGAWVPEPWASRLVLDGGGHVLVDEATLWPAGRFVTTELIVRTQYLKDHPDVVRKLLAGQVEATDFVTAHPAEAQQTANTAIKGITNSSLSAAVLSAAWSHLSFTVDPLVGTLDREAAAATEAGLLAKVNLTDIADLSLLNSVLKSEGKARVSGR